MRFPSTDSVTAGQTTAVELKDNILSLIVEFPRPCGMVARRLLATRDGTLKLAIACDAIGFAYARQILDSVSAAQWQAMDSLLRENVLGLAEAPVGAILLEVYKLLVAECMGWDPQRHVDDPFEFLHQLSPDRLAALLRAQDPAELALLAAFRSPEEIARLLALLVPAARRQVVLRISRLERLPVEAAREAAVRFAQRLQTRPPAPIETVALREQDPVNDAVTRIIEGGPSESEARLLEFIAKESPAIRAQVGRAIQATGVRANPPPARNAENQASPAVPNEPEI